MMKILVPTMVISTWILSFRYVMNHELILNDIEGILFGSIVLGTSYGLIKCSVLDSRINKLIEKKEKLEREEKVKTYKLRLVK